MGGLFVDPPAWRRGIGRRLLDEVRCLHDTLELEVFAANRTGRAFYACYGFVPVGRRVDAATDEAVWRLRLGTGEPEPSD